LIRISVSQVVISLDPEVAFGTQAVYPRLLTRRISAHPLFHLAPRGVFLASHIAIAYGSLLHYLFTFTCCLLRQREVCFLWHSPCPQQISADALSYRARYPLEPGLSSSQNYLASDHFLPTLLSKTCSSVILFL